MEIKRVLVLAMMVAGVLNAMGERVNLNGVEYCELDAEGTKIVKGEWANGKETGVLLDVATTRVAKIKKVGRYEVVGTGGDLLVWNERGKGYIYNVQRNRLEALAVGDSVDRGVSASPNGRNVFFARGKELYVKRMDYDGAVVRVRNEELLAKESDLAGMDYQSEWSADNRFCVVVATPGGEVKAGGRKHQPRVYVLDAFYKSLKEVALPATDFGYVKAIVRTHNPEEMGVVTLSADQTNAKLWTLNTKSLMYKALLDEKESEWFDASAARQTAWMKDGKVVWMNEEDGWKHLQLYNANGIKMKTLTTGDYDVTRYWGYDSVKKLCFFERMVRVKDGGLRSETCSVDLNGTVKVLPHTEQSVKGMGEDGEWMGVKTTNGDTLDCYLYKPKGWKENLKYGGIVVTNQVGERCEKSVERIRNLQEKGYVVMEVQTRGGDGRGEGWRKSVHTRVGVLESIDAMEGAKQLVRLPYVDAKRIGLYGEGKQALIALLAMENNAGVVKKCVVVNPVTDLRNEQAEWTEKLMKRPQASGSYDGSSAVKGAGKMNGMVLMVKTGVGNDENFYGMTDALVKSGKLFRMMVYRTEAEGHLINMIDDFLK